MNATFDNIRVSTTPNFADFLRFVRWVAFRQVRVLIPFAIFALICFLLAPIIPLEQRGALARYQALSPALFFPAIVFVLLPLFSYYGACKRWRNAPELQVVRTYIFNDEGVAILAESFNSHVAWKYVVTADKHRGLVFLGTAQRQFYLVPVHDFESPEQFNRFLELVRSKVAKCRV
jgi:hypothetical protein